MTIKKRVFTLVALLLALIGSNSMANEPDSAYLFAYGENGLRFAWSIDNKNWNPIGNGHIYLKSDFGRWGSQKRMYDPVVIRDREGKWHCMWTLNDEVGIVAHTSSENLTYWKPQSYPYLFEGRGNCSMIEVGYDADNDNFNVSWVDTKGGNAIYGVSTSDFKHFSKVKELSPSARINQRVQVSINGTLVQGTVHKVVWTEVDHLVATMQITRFKDLQNGERMKDDVVRFANLKPVDAVLDIDTDNVKAVSNMMMGIFFEDINYSADGGIYAELVQNRGFEYSLSDKNDRDKSWNGTKAWSLVGDDATFSLDTVQPLHPNNRHYAVLNLQRKGAKLCNEGFAGIVTDKGSKYDFSVFARNADSKARSLIVRLTSPEGTVVGQTTVRVNSAKWSKYTSVITANATSDNVVLEIIPQSEGEICLDMVSLFPQNTFKNRKNGLRADLAQVLADMKPRFVRFPGGCVAHGDGIGNIYNWKNTIGPLEARVPQRNLWGYHQTAGLGYFEYFQFCEDIGAAPLPVVAAGVPCQNSGVGGHGQQCGIPMNEMQDYIQDIFDLIEWANGDPKKSKWARMRADAGHPKPFNLKYLGVGNEDLISDVFEERYTMICNAVKEKYPEIVIVGTAGPFYEGSDYVEGWRIATQLGLPMIDEHYYNPPGWFINNHDYYDRYDRTKPKVYLGEYAAHLPDRRSTVETALAEALHLISCERNGDVVSMTSYAPLLAKEGFTQWRPDLIYFNNRDVKPTTGYYVQKLFGNNAGDQYVASRLRIDSGNDAVTKRIACSVVRDGSSGDVILKLVNLLPVEVSVALGGGADLFPSGNAVKTLFAGDFQSEAVLPVETVIGIEDIRNMVLPAYSLTVVRIGNNR